MSTSDYPAPGVRGPRLAGRQAFTRARGLSTDIWILVALVALATAIRIVTINDQSFWADEALTAYEAQLPFGAMLHTVAHVETTPPLYFVLIWGWAKLFGTSEVALRSFSMLAGIALVPIAFLSARELASRWAGVIAAAFVAVNPFMIWFSQEARAYMLLALLTAAGFLWFVRAREEPSRKNLAWWAVCSSLALMTHFFAGFVVAPEALWLLWRSRQRSVLAAVGAVAAVQVAMAPFALVDRGHGPGWIAAHPLKNRVGTTALEWVISVEYRRTAVVFGFAGAAVLAVLVVLLLVFGGDERSRNGARVAATIGGCGILLPLVFAFAGQDYFLSRNVMPAFIPIVTLVAIACAVPHARVLGVALAAVLLAGFSVAALDVQTHPYLERPDWRNVAHALGAAPATRAIIAADGFTADPLKIYMRGVSWVQPQRRRTLISEVDIVGATKRLALLAPRRRGNTPPQSRRTHYGRPLPAPTAPPGTTELARFRVDNWVVARFALRHPEWLTIKTLIARAPLFFKHAPESLLIFVQRSTN